MRYAVLMRKAVFLFMLSLFICADTARCGRTVHVIVALADNKNQGIVPVPAKLGNGDDPANNLYWGALYGVKTHFKKSSQWVYLSSTNKPLPGVLERCTFKSKSGDVKLVADAYRGSEIKKAVEVLLTEVSGRTAADLVVYIGHNGLMEFSIDKKDIKRGSKGRDAIILACKSKPYFKPWLDRLKGRGLLLTTGLMAPEAYTLEAALEAWKKGKGGGEIREQAAKAYNKYQKCGIRGARRLFYTEVK